MNYVIAPRRDLSRPESEYEICAPSSSLFYILGGDVGWLAGWLVGDSCSLIPRAEDERTFNLHVPFNVFLTLAARCLRRFIFALALLGGDFSAWGRSHPHLHLAHASASNMDQGPAGTLSEILKVSSVH